MDMRECGEHVWMNASEAINTHTDWRHARASFTMKESLMTGGAALGANWNDWREFQHCSYKVIKFF